MMRPRAQRALFIGAAIFVLACAGMLAAIGLRDSVSYFRTPTDIVEMGSEREGMRVRIGGLVAEGSVVRHGASAYFDVTDGRSAVTVETDAILPDMFAEGQGVVAEGVITGEGVVRATRVLARHDENYMPAEAYEALRRAAERDYGTESQSTSAARGS